MYIKCKKNICVLQLFLHTLVDNGYICNMPVRAATNGNIY